MSKTPITDRNTVGYPQGEFVPVRVAKELESQLSALEADAQRYQEKADAIHKYLTENNSTALLAVITELSLDAQKRAALSAGQQEKGRG